MHLLFNFIFFYMIVFVYNLFWFLLRLFFLLNAYEDCVLISTIHFLVTRHNHLSIHYIHFSLN